MKEKYLITREGLGKCNRERVPTAFSLSFRVSYSATEGDLRVKG